MIKEVKTPESIKKILKTISYSNSNHGDKYTTIRDKDGYIKHEHIVIWENHFGKKPQGAVIHHINEIKTDNRIENLMLFPSGAAHMNYHKLQRRLLKMKSG